MKRSKMLTAFALTAAAMLAINGCHTTVVERPAPQPEHHDDYHDDHRDDHPQPPPDHHDDRQ
jgi:hypothetical protein